MTYEKHFKIGSTAISVHILSILSVFALIFAESSIYSISVIFCAAVHELGHIAMIYFFGAGIREFRFLPFGAEIRMKREVNYSSELIISLAGPLANFVLAAVMYILFLFFPNPVILFTVICSIFLAVVNLVPVRGFDGGRMVRCIALSRLEYEKALKFIKISEQVSLIILSALSIAAIRAAAFNISLIIICLYLFVSVYKNDY